MDFSQALHGVEMHIIVNSLSNILQILWHYQKRSAKYIFFIFVMNWIQNKALIQIKASHSIHLQPHSIHLQPNWIQN